MTLKTEDLLVTTLDPDEVQRAAQGMTAELHRVAKRDVLKLVAASLALLLGSGTAFLYWSWPLGLFLLVAIIVVFVNLRKGSRRRRMGVALPFVLKALGLEHVASGPDFNQSLPARLFPRVAVPRVSTVFSGAIDGCPVAIAEIIVRDRNDDSDQPIFEGLVLRVGLSSALPDFLILDEGLSKKLEGTTAGTWFFNKPHFEVGPLQRSQTFPRGVHGLGLWLHPSADRSGEPLAAVLKVLSYPPREAGIHGRIHSATNDKRAIFVALRPSERSIQIEMGTPSATNATLAIHATYEWLAQPVALAKALVQAERTSLGKS